MFTISIEHWKTKPRNSSVWGSFNWNGKASQSYIHGKMSNSNNEVVMKRR